MAVVVIALKITSKGNCVYSEWVLVWDHGGGVGSTNRSGALKFRSERLFFPAVVRLTVLSSRYGKDLNKYRERKDREKANRDNRVFGFHLIIK